MVRAKTRESERLSYAQNPAAGTMLAAPAGGQAEAEFDFYNDSPDVASFYLEVDGLGPGWVSGDGTAYEAYAAASGGGQLRLTLTPPIMSSVGEYDFRVRLMSGGMPVNDGTALILRVDPPVEQSAEVSPPPAPVEMIAPAAHGSGNGSGTPVAEPIAEPTAPKPAAPKTRAPRVKAVAPPPVIKTPPASEMAAEEAVNPEPVAPVAVAPPIVVIPDPVVVEPSAPEPTPVVDMAPPVVTPSPPLPTPTPRTPPAQPPIQQAPPIPAPVRPTPDAVTPVIPIEPAPMPTPRPVSSAQAPTPRPAPAPVTPTRPAPSPPDEEPMLVDYQPRGGADAGQPIAYDDDEEEVAAESFLLDPKDGALIPLRPGEKLLLRFPFVNDSPRERTYILDEDRALEDGWLTLVQDQVNLTRNGQGELSVRLTPPINADPGDYPFTVTTGPQGGQVLPRVLTLSVLATPAVQLVTKDKQVKVGPFTSDVVFPLSVESAGNADTAFRVAVKTPQNEATDGGPVGSGDVYESGPWRYLFDKEMESLRSPMTGQTPRPVPISLRVRRKGIWWFGFKERHQFRVAAVPVTEPGNGGKPGNSLDLTAVRSRILPFPALLLIPILLLIMLFLSGGASDLSVTDAQYNQGNAFWIVEPKNADKKPIDLAWSAKPLALLRLTGAPQGQEDKPPLNVAKFGSGHYSDSVGVSTDNRDVLYHYRVSRLLGGADQDVLAHFIYTRSDTPMVVTDSVKGRALPGKDISLTVPAHGYARLYIRNGARRYNRLNWWLVKGLDASSANKFKYNISNGSKDPGQTEQFLIQRNPTASNPGTEEQIVFVTTDANRPVLTVTLKSAP